MSLDIGNITRREFFNALAKLTGAIVVGSALTKVPGCGAGLGIAGEEVQLNSVEDYTHNPDITSFQASINSRFNSFIFQLGASPPKLDGRWNLNNGQRWIYNNQFFGPETLASGRFYFWNQAPEGTIGMSYYQDVASQQGEGSGKIFIRGYDYKRFSQFTIFSSLKIDDPVGGSSLMASIYTGSCYPDSGKINLNYMMVPVQKYNGNGFYPSYGTMDLAKHNYSGKLTEILGVGCVGNLK